MGLLSIDSQPVAIGAIEATNLALKPKTAAENSMGTIARTKWGGGCARVQVTTGALLPGVQLDA